MFELMDSFSQSAVIKVLGVGGGGGNAVSHMVQAGLEGVDFICINTDAQALKHSKVRTSLQIGCNITKGLGAGADPEVGRQAAMEDRDRIIELIEGCDMLFITAGMGGGTGTGAAPVVAQVAKELGILTVAVVTRPFEMEGNKRSRVADQGMLELSKYVDSLITIPNQKLLTVLGSTTTLLDAFKAANTVLQGAVQGIAELITRPGPDQRRLRRRAHRDVGDRHGDDGLGRARRARTARAKRPRRRSPARCSRTSISPALRASWSTSPPGMDLSIGEFQEVGNVIKQFASRRRHRGRRHRHRPGNGQPDPRHGGCDRSRQAGGCADRRPQPVAAMIAPPPDHACRAPKSPMAPTDYAMFDKPTVQRQRAVGRRLAHGGANRRIC